LSFARSLSLSLFLSLSSLFEKNIQQVEKQFSRKEKKAEILTNDFIQNTEKRPKMHCKSRQLYILFCFFSVKKNVPLVIYFLGGLVDILTFG
jgi:hypothetical protein